MHLVRRGSLKASSFGTDGQKMGTTAALLVLGLLVFVASCATVGVRLLRLGWNTRQMPETLLGLGFVLLLIGLPMIGMSGIGQGTVGEVQIVPLVEGLSSIALAGMSVSAFVACTFHPERRWWLAIPIALGAAEFAILDEIVSLLREAERGALASSVVRDSAMWARLPLALSFGWMAAEGCAEYRKARTREALGLGDAIVTNRFALLTVAGGFAVVNSIVGTLLHANGMTPLAHPAAAAALACGALVAGAALLLAFAPPARYVRWIEASSATS